MKKPIFLILFGLTALFASGQNSFMIYSFKGTVTVTDNKVEAPAKVGKMMNNSSSIKIAAGGVATVICDQATIFTINKAGTYSMSKFSDSCKVASNSVSNNYLKYVWAQINTEHGSPGSNRKAYMSSLGAVSRSINNIWIDPRLDTVNYTGINGEFPLSWKSYADAKDFEFLLYSKDNLSEPIYKTTINKLKLPVSSILSKIKPGNSYLWTVAIKGEENDELKVLNYVTKDNYDAVIRDVKAQGAAFEASAEESYRIAFMLEDRHYLAEAYQYYTKAATADPTNMLYRSTLMSFKKDYEIK